MRRVWMVSDCDEIPNMGSDKCLEIVICGQRDKDLLE
jgi:hypothetical protein